LSHLAIDVVSLASERSEEAALVLADAFLDDPAWRAIGPDRERGRLRLLRSFYRVAVKEALRYGGPSWCAVGAGEVVGVALAFGDGLRFPPPRATIVEGPPFLLAGPGPMLRGLKVDALMKRRHPHEPHSYLWQLVAHPSVQRQGIGRALLGEVIADAEQRRSPVYLETARSENVPYYGSFGFEVLGEAPLPRGANMWFMERPGPR
jgi:ribosomal protein S18 acetylase RimI-like enzyme